jgi:hypothetical protein
MPPKTTMQRMIKYGTNVNGTSNECFCNTNDDNKVKKDATNNNSANISRAQLNSSIVWIQANVGGWGGTVRFSNRPQEVNYLGRVAGQPGGSGRPPVNKF